MKILLAGHICSPYRGSEYSFTWNCGWHLSAQHEVWVATYDHGPFREEVERYRAEHPNPNLHFEYVGVPRDPWKHGSQRGWTRHYMMWQREVLKVAQRLHALHKFDVTQHVSFGTVSAAPELWRLPVPFVWGPVGGGQFTPRAFGKYFGRGPERAKEMLRTARIAAVPFIPSVRRAAQHSALILATNHESVRVLRRAGAPQVSMFLDSGLSPEHFPSHPPQHAPGDSMTLLWVGKLEHRKALPLALEALAQINDPRIRLRIAGDGPQRQEWEKLATQLHLGARVQFLGQLPWEQMSDFYRQGDAFLFTSIRDSFGTPVLEALSHSLPVIALDHQGVAAFLPAEAGIKVPVTSPRQTVEQIGAAIRLLAASPDLRQRMGDAGWALARNETWDVRAQRMTQLYQGLLQNKSSASAVAAA